MVCEIDSVNSLQTDSRPGGRYASAHTNTVGGRRGTRIKLIQLLQSTDVCVKRPENHARGVGCS